MTVSRLDGLVYNISALVKLLCGLVVTLHLAKHLENKVLPVIF